MSSSVEIETERNENALVVPLQSIVARNDLYSNKPDDFQKNIPSRAVEYIFVYDRNSSKVSAIPVITGVQDMESIVIENGITDSTLFVAGPYNAVTRILKNGTLVDAKKEF